MPFSIWQSFFLIYLLLFYQTKFSYLVIFRLSYLCVSIFLRTIWRSKINISYTIPWPNADVLTPYLPAITMQFWVHRMISLSLRMIYFGPKINRFTYFMINKCTHNYYLVHFIRSNCNIFFPFPHKWNWFS